MNRSGPWVWTRPASRDRAGEVLLRLVGAGHPDIAARHHKTLEFSAASSISGRATCVVAVDTAATWVAPAGLAGPVDLVITVGDDSAELTAVANPGWRPGGAAVVRRSANRLPGTLATDADSAAADLPRPLVARLARPGVQVEVVVRARTRHADGRTGLVLLALDGSGPAPGRLAAELAAADVVVAEDAAARDLALSVAATDDQSWLPDAGGGPDGHGLADDAVRRVAEGAADRVLVLAAAGLPGATVSPLLARPDLARVEVAGLPSHLAAAAASPRRAAVHLAGPLQPGTARAALRQVPPDVQLVFSAAGERLSGLLDLVAAMRDVGTGVVLPEPRVNPWPTWGPVSAAPAGPRGREVVCCLDGTDPDAGADLEAPVAALTRRLAADGVPTKTLATALAAVLGWPRGRAYDTVTRLREGAPPPSGP